MKMLEKIYPDDVELYISQEEGPGITVAAKNDRPPPFTPAGDFLAVS